MQARALGLGCMLGCMVESGLGIEQARASRACSTTSTPTQPPDRTRPSPMSSSSTVSRHHGACRAQRRACGVVDPLPDPRRGFSAMRTTKSQFGVLRYGATTSSNPRLPTRVAGGRRKACPSSQPSTTRSASSRTRRRRRRHPGWPFPAASMDILRRLVVHRLDVENRLHVFPNDDDPELRTRRGTTSSCATCAAAGRYCRLRRRDLDVPARLRADRRIGLRNREDRPALELDLRSATAGPALRSSCPAGRRDRDRRLGVAVDAIVTTSSPARRNGSSSRGPSAWQTGKRRPALGRGPGLDHPSRLLRRDRRPLSRQRAASAPPLPPSRDDGDRGAGGGPHPSRRSASSSSCTSASHCLRGAPASRRSALTPAISARTGRARRSQPSRARPDCPPTTRFVSAREDPRRVHGLKAALRRDLLRRPRSTEGNEGMNRVIATRTGARAPLWAAAAAAARKG